LALAVAADRVRRGVGPADEVEVVADDPSVLQRGVDGLALGVVGVDRDDLDPRAISAGRA
jgi:hypothetical protein